MRLENSRAVCVCAGAAHAFHYATQKLRKQLANGNLALLDDKFISMFLGTNDFSSTRVLHNCLVCTSSCYASVTYAFSASRLAVETAQLVQVPGVSDFGLKLDGCLLERELFVNSFYHLPPVTANLQ